eukprot:3320836-Rhodomonas_salina.1
MRCQSLAAGHSTHVGRQVPEGACICGPVFLSVSIARSETVCLCMESVSRSVQSLVLECLFHSFCSDPRTAACALPRGRSITALTVRSPALVAACGMSSQASHIRLVGR